MTVSKEEQRRRHILRAALKLAEQALDDADSGNPDQGIWACEFLFEVTAQHKRERADEIFAPVV